MEYTLEETQKALDEVVAEGGLVKFKRNGEIYYQEPTHYFYGGSEDGDEIMKVNL